MYSYLQSVYSYLQKITILLFIFTATEAYANQSLFYLEAQVVGGYLSVENGPIFYSMDQMDTMQKPSIGFDYIQKFSSASGDWGSMAIQARLAYDKDEKYYVEPQLYNAYVKIKTTPADIWIGHDRPAAGLSSYFDSHGLLLPTLAMLGFGFDRDWGAGLYRDFDWGNMALSGTTGTGMPVYFENNYYITGRIGIGVLSRDNYTIGLSGSYGKIKETMGYHLLLDTPVLFSAGGVDAAFFINNFEIRIEGIAGKKDNLFAGAAFARFGVNLMEEERLKIEVQPVYLRTAGEDNWQTYAGMSFKITGDFTARAMYAYDYVMDDHRVIFQLYYYGSVI